MFTLVSPGSVYEELFRNQYRCSTHGRKFRGQTHIARTSTRSFLVHVRCVGETTEPAPAPFDSIDPVELKVRKDLEAAGIELEQLLNPSKVVSLERKIGEYRAKLAQLTSSAGAAEKERLERQLSKMQRELEREKRAIMHQWLKDLFVAQGILTAALGGWMAYESSLPLYLRALGFWMIWLFTIPSLRARKPSAAEKNALNASFLIAPLMNLLLPTLVKDPAQLWVAQVIQLTGCYLYFGAWGTTPAKSAKNSETAVKANATRDRPTIRLPTILRWLDWGSWR